MAVGAARGGGSGGGYPGGVGVVLREGKVLGRGSGVSGEGLGTALTVRLGMYPLMGLHCPP
jgi:hypothetical protein